jgi:hypothetical protein
LIPSVFATEASSDDAVVASGGSASGGAKLSSSLSHIPFDFTDVNEENIEDSHAWQEFSEGGAQLVG